MVDKIKVSFTESAIKDLEDILAYYEEQKTPHVGNRLVGQVIGDIEHLKDQPDMGRIVPEFEQKNLRELIRPPFRIVYLRETFNVRIVRVWRSEKLLILP
ncbi:MAG: type II toxin-antitoxin system RelE/ParE family toxin [Proteobacteria bacterium]|nr:type II toxin-antitoxin system RelE/ParE family toxin [Pseudomonadota bacterium]